ncbi:hypothetical protein [Burkholderia cenocepacia]|uniref:Uncharacterized protein n=1 Tax=Burkholderia cenocepacia TaxID=95486 RepID=A0ABD4U604_9BURK|nr:hypothetical protein [Burkholderia cenocepacia]MCW3694168.1 hypothetical protein [Burkholderia cenocepacia]MCW3702605.1 hypothetical protein [Burkholderia cenocepacia]MCW3709875.1 hypothetical protein [Burkholderia cenocepacia]MCW3718123.1 hypothetical protein [Burkholderia cenocepacia]MCW3726743.1 hypothetical protein [Burkholderia cenocepacia]
MLSFLDHGARVGATAAERRFLAAGHPARFKMRISCIFFHDVSARLSLP